MHGTLRFILALLVALSHLGVLFSDFNQGVFSVVIFYMLAGMVSYKLISKYFQNQPYLYYKNRMKRIFPLYFYALSIAVTAYFLGASSYFISKIPTFIDWISNITVIPLSYYMFTKQDTFTLVPPVWSLGVELQFYIFAPILFTYNKLFIYTFIISLSIFILASVGVLDTNIFGYRLLLGVIFIFLLGFLIQKAKEKDYKALKILKQTYLLLILLLVYIYFNDYKALYNYETLTALLFGIPLLLYFSIRLPLKIDNYLGSLSYLVFLLHFPSLWLCQIYFLEDVNIFTVLGITLFLSVLAMATIKNTTNKSA